jgi:hypothetical protein
VRPVVALNGVPHSPSLSLAAGLRPPLVEIGCKEVEVNAWECKDRACCRKPGVGTRWHVRVWYFPSGRMDAWQSACCDGAADRRAREELVIDPATPDEEQRATLCLFAEAPPGRRNESTLIDCELAVHRPATALH